MENRILFISDKTADGRSQEIIGILHPNKIWVGREMLGEDVVDTIETYKLDLTKDADRLLLLQKFSGAFLFAMEAHKFKGDIIYQA